MSGLAVVTAARRYRALLVMPGVVRVALPSFIGRMPYGMTTLLFVLAVEHGTGSFTVAGLATGAHAALTAVTAPWLGRLADRGHAAVVLASTGIAYAAMLTALIGALWLHAPVAVILLIAGVSGALNPPIGAVTRVVLPGLAPKQADTAYALDTIFVELTFVVGPMLIALITWLSGPYAAVIFTGMLSAGGAVALATAPGLRDRYRGIVTVPLARGERRAKLLTASIVTVLIVGALESAAYGVIEVAIPAYASELGSPSASGAIVAAWSSGSIIGGIWFSGLNPTMRKAKLFALLMTLNTVGFASIMLASGVTSLAALLLLGGLVIAPTTTIECALVTALAPHGRTTEAFTWTGTGIFVGFAAGTSVSGFVVGQGGGLLTTAIIATALVGVGALLATVMSRRISGDCAVSQPVEDIGAVDGIPYAG
ncbi:MFS family permease [Allocatelliglobosispora scoriae]|uniref:MFS family permease n=1 Tax=Allocatelliglobosispora scoriae TaxID=643052 RepID=A0A841BTV0_9ACTN|nr:MFS transporter [Allocatelliglobosispora scoriae]MBB5870172.1 MFS family permease [Allocatelliglobosispora scoriae]